MPLLQIPLQILLLAVLAFAAVQTVRGAYARWRMAPMDIGALFSFVVALYGTLPLAGIYLAFAGYGTVPDGRLRGSLPEESTVIAVGWMYVVFLAGFVVGYARIHAERDSDLTTRLAIATSRDVTISLALFVVIQIGISGIRLAYGIKSGDDYLDSYAVIRDQPLIVQQTLGVLTASRLAAAMLVIVSVIAWRPRWHTWTALFILLLVAETFIAGGSRRDAFLCALAYLIARTVYGPRVRPQVIVALCALGLIAFTIAGMLRQGLLAGEQTEAIPLLQDGEFAMFFGNAMDLLDKADAIRSPAVSAALYLVDVLRLVPRQIIGDFKVDPAVLYASTFYPEFFESGGAFAFGAIAESVLGFGVPEALVRGLILGITYALIRRQLLDRHRVDPMHVFVYVWFATLAYEGLRDTTLTLLPRFLMQLLPLLIVLRLLGFGRRRAPSLLASHRTAPTAAPTQPRKQAA